MAGCCCWRSDCERSWGTDPPCENLDFREAIPRAGMVFNKGIGNWLSAEVGLPDRHHFILGTGTVTVRLALQLHVLFHM